MLIVRVAAQIGHGLALKDEVFREFTFSEDMKNLAKSLKFHKDPRGRSPNSLCTSVHSLYTWLDN